MEMNEIAWAKILRPGPACLL